MEARKNTLPGKNVATPKKISNFVIMGDSLSDTGTMYHRDLLGCIPMSFLTGLLGRSPDGSFTNGYAWPDLLCGMLASEFIIKELLTGNKLDRMDIADAIINGDLNIKKKLSEAYSLNNDKLDQYKGMSFIRSYCEGGLSAHDYSWTLSSSPTRFFTRLVVSTLDEKRKLLLQDDQKNKLSSLEKAEILVIEWSGANDLATVNEKPSIKEVNNAIAARVKNVEKLIAQGYQNFVLFDLPDLSLTPRYQALNLVHRKNAQTCSGYFNKELNKAAQQLSAKYPHTSISVFGISNIMTDAYHHPEKYGLDSAKLKIPYTKSADFKMQKNGTSPAKGYMFWDDVHPTADVHALLAERFYLKYRMTYQFIAPHNMHPKEVHPALDHSY